MLLHLSQNIPCMICRAEQMYAGSTSTPIRYIVSQSAEQPASPISLPLSNAPTAKASLSLLIINGRTPSKTASGRLIVSDIPIPVKKTALRKITERSYLFQVLLYLLLGFIEKQAVKKLSDG